MAYTLTLLFLMINRTRAIRQYVNTATKYKKIDGRIGRIKALLTSIWLICILTTSPLLVGLLESWPFPARYSCHVADEWAYIYGGATSIFPYVITWIGFLICSLLIYCATRVEKKREEIEKRGQLTVANKLATNTAIFIASNQMWHEMKNIILVSVLLIVYMLLLVPYIAFTKSNGIYQYWSPYNLNLYRNLSTTSYGDISLDDTDILEVSARSLGLDGTNNLTIHDPGLWEVPEIKEGNSDVETVFVWMRFIHFALVPIVVLILNKDIRQKAGELFCCGRSRSTSIAPRPISALLHRQNLEFNKKHQQKRFKLCDYHVPVLFATQEGLYLRILDNELATPSKQVHDLEAGKNNMWTIEPQFLTEICDLKIESQTFVTHFSDISAEDDIKHEDYDEGFHENNFNHDHEHGAHHDKKIKKSVHFRNTVIDIRRQMDQSDSGHSQSSEHREYRDVRQRKMTGLGDRHHDHDHQRGHHGSHHLHQQDHHSAKSHRKHRRASFNLEGHHSEHHRRRFSD